MIRRLIVRAVLALSVFFCVSVVSNAQAPTQQATLPAYMSLGVIDLKESVKVAQNNFEDMYFQTLLQDEKFFDDAYNNNLVISSEMNWDFAKNGVIFMKLLDFLEKKDDQDAKQMLAKLNELFYLIFHRHLSHCDLPREKQVDLVHALHYLFNVKNSKDEPILRSHLTRIFIYAMMTEVMGLHYHEKKEILFFAYEDFRKVLKSTVDGCVDKAVILGFIDTFINDFSAYGIAEPIIREKNVKRWIIWVTVLGAIAGLCYYVNVKFKTWEQFKDKVNELVASMTETFSESSMEYLIKPMVKETFDEAEKRGATMGKNLAAGMTEGLVYEDVDAPEVDMRKKRPNRNTAKLAQGMGKNLVDGIAYEDEDAPKPAKKRKSSQATKDLAKGFGADLAVGLATKAAGLTHEALRGIVEEPTKEEKRDLVAAKRKAARDAKKAAEEALADGEVGSDDDEEVVDELKPKPSKYAKRLLRMAGAEAGLALLDNVEDLNVDIDNRLVGKVKCKVKSHADRLKDKRAKDVLAEKEIEEEHASDDGKPAVAPKKGRGKGGRGAKPAAEDKGDGDMAIDGLADAGSGDVSVVRGTVKPKPKRGGAKLGDASPKPSGVKPSAVPAPKPATGSTATKSVDDRSRWNPSRLLW